MRLGLDTAHVIVLGVGGSIGPSVVQAFANEGAVISGVSKSPLSIQRLTKICQSSLGLTRPCDAQNSQALKEFVLSAVELHGPADAIVHNLGSPFIESGAELDIASWTKAIETEIVPLTLIREMPFLFSPGGAVTFVGSVSSTIPGEISDLTHGPIKAAGFALIKRIAREFAIKGLRANVVSPGFVYAPGSRHMQRIMSVLGVTTEEEALEIYCKRIPLGTPASPETVANAIAFLSSPAAKHMTGQNVFVDGGYSICGPGGF